MPVRLSKWLIAFLLVACSQTSGTAVGVVTAVDGSLSDITSFTVLSSGTEQVFVPIEGQSYEFPISHLREHLRTGEPVVVEWELRGDDKYATSLADG